MAARKYTRADFVVANSRTIQKQIVRLYIAGTVPDTLRVDLEALGYYRSRGFKTYTKGIPVQEWNVSRYNDKPDRNKVRATLIRHGIWNVQGPRSYKHSELVS